MLSNVPSVRAYFVCFISCFASVNLALRTMVQVIWLEKINTSFRDQGMIKQRGEQVLLGFVAYLSHLNASWITDNTPISLFIPCISNELGIPDAKIFHIFLSLWENGNN